jgi:hypothetical protein
MQDRRIDDAEDGRIGADAKREREHSHQGEARALAERATPIQ